MNVDLGIAGNKLEWVPPKERFVRQKGPFVRRKRHQGQRGSSGAHVPSPEIVQPTPFRSLAGRVYRPRNKRSDTRRSSFGSTVSTTNPDHERSASMAPRRQSVFGAAGAAVMGARSSKSRQRHVRGFSRASSQASQSSLLELMFAQEELERPSPPSYKRLPRFRQYWDKQSKKGLPRDTAQAEVEVDETPRLSSATDTPTGSLPSETTPTTPTPLKKAPSQGASETWSQAPSRAPSSTDSLEVRHPQTDIEDVYCPPLTPKSPVSPLILPTRAQRAAMRSSTGRVTLLSDADTDQSKSRSSERPSYFAASADEQPPNEGDSDGDDDHDADSDRDSDALVTERLPSGCAEAAMFASADEGGDLGTSPEEHMWPDSTGKLSSHSNHKEGQSVESDSVYWGDLEKLQTAGRPHTSWVVNVLAKTPVPAKRPKTPFVKARDTPSDCYSDSVRSSSASRPGSAVPYQPVSAWEAVANTLRPKSAASSQQRYRQTFSSTGKDSSASTTSEESQIQPELWAAARKAANKWNDRHRPDTAGLPLSTLLSCALMRAKTARSSRPDTPTVMSAVGALAGAETVGTGALQAPPVSGGERRLFTAQPKPREKASGLPISPLHKAYGCPRRNDKAPMFLPHADNRQDVRPHSAKGAKAQHSETRARPTTPHVYAGYKAGEVRSHLPSAVDTGRPYSAQKCPLSVEPVTVSRPLTPHVRCVGSTNVECRSRPRHVDGRPHSAGASQAPKSAPRPTTPHVRASYGTVGHSRSESGTAVTGRPTTATPTSVPSLQLIQGRSRPGTAHAKQTEGGDSALPRSTSSAQETGRPYTSGRWSDHHKPPPPRPTTPLCRGVEGCDNQDSRKSTYATISDEYGNRPVTSGPYSTPRPPTGRPATPLVLIQALDHQRAVCQHVRDSSSSSRPNTARRATGQCAECESALRPRTSHPVSFGLPRPQALLQAVSQGTRPRTAVFSVTRTAKTATAVSRPTTPLVLAPQRSVREYLSRCPRTNTAPGGPLSLVESATSAAQHRPSSSGIIWTQVPEHSDSVTPDAKQDKLEEDLIVQARAESGEEIVAEDSAQSSGQLKDKELQQNDVSEVSQQCDADNVQEIQRNSKVELQHELQDVRVEDPIERAEAESEQEEEEETSEEAEKMQAVVPDGAAHQEVTVQEQAEEETALEAVQHETAEEVVQHETAEEAVQHETAEEIEQEESAEESDAVEDNETLWPAEEETMGQGRAFRGTHDALENTHEALQLAEQLDADLQPFDDFFEELFDAFAPLSGLQDPQPSPKPAAIAHLHPSTASRLVQEHQNSTSTQQGTSWGSPATQTLLLEEHEASLTRRSAKPSNPPPAGKPFPLLKRLSTSGLPAWAQSPRDTHSDGRSAPVGTREAMEVQHRLQSAAVDQVCLVPWSGTSSQNMWSVAPLHVKKATPEPRQQPLQGLSPQGSGWGSVRQQLQSLQQHPVAPVAPVAPPRSEPDEQVKVHREHAEKPVVAKRPISMDVDVAEDRPGADETADKRRRQFEEARQERLARLQQQNAQRRQAKAQARQQQAEQARELQKRRNELLQQRRQSALCEPQGSRSNSSSRSSLPRSRATTAASNASAGQRSTGRPQTQERVTDCQCSAQRSPDGARSNKRLIRNAVSYVCLAGETTKTERENVLAAAEQAADHHLVVLLRRAPSLKFKGLYALHFNGHQIKQPSHAVKLYGDGPRIIDETVVESYMKYDSAGKDFTVLGSKAFAGTTDAVCLKAKSTRKLRRNNRATGNTELSGENK